MIERKIHIWKNDNKCSNWNSQTQYIQRRKHSLQAKKIHSERRGKRSWLVEEKQKKDMKTENKGTEEKAY